MKNKLKNSGLSLMEEVMVVASVALILYIAMPSVKNWFNTMETPAGAKTLISSALASARAIAAQQQRYAGIRFQHAYYNDPQNPQPEKSPLKMPQYMIFIIYDNNPSPYGTGIENGFRAIEGVEPIKLPENIGAMDLYIHENSYKKIDSDNDLRDDLELNDATTFSIIFSPAGKVIVRDVQTRNRDGADYNDDFSEDDIFNIEQNVKEGFAMFVQDEDRLAYASSLELMKEPSRRAFIIYDRSIFSGLDENRRYSDYIEDLKPVYLNSYTGTMIDK
ncbi:MAG: hypothetical protein JW804_04230 [Sedimentisphaerales bacterium]|nr:hypothetical protein [Sedimentisphaerales bacterium]